MAIFGKSSLSQRATLHPDLQLVLDEVIKHFDFTIVEGFRGKEAQNRAYDKGTSEKRWPHGKHNQKPSRAVDLAPYPIDWSNKEAARQRFCYLAGYIMVCGLFLGVKLRWGGDWNQNQDTRDEHFRDLPHFELI